MPSSKPLAVGLAVLVLASGCGMLPGGGGDAPTTTADAPDYHELVFGGHASANPYEATVTVTRNGEQVFEESFASDGNGTYRELTRFREQGPYTVTVNTTLPDAGPGNESARFTVNGTLGNATAVQLSFRSIDHAALELPRRPLDGGLSVLSNYRSLGGDDAVDLDVRVRYRGDLVVDETVAVGADERTEIAALDRTGVYHVAARTDGDWQNDTAVVTRPASRVTVVVNVRGGVKDVTVWPTEP
jgi:hypothetical protein